MVCLMICNLDLLSLCLISLRIFDTPLFLETSSSFLSITEVKYFAESSERREELEKLTTTITNNASLINTTASKLPRVQNPTITLLQKARGKQCTTVWSFFDISVECCFFFSRFDGSIAFTTVRVYHLFCFYLTLTRMAYVCRRAVTKRSSIFGPDDEW